MVVWNAAFLIANKDGTIKSIEGVQDEAGTRLVIGTEAEWDMALRLPKFAEFLDTIGVGGISYLPPEVASYSFRFGATATNGYVHVCGSNEQLVTDVVVDDVAIYDELVADVGFNEYFSSGSVVLINTNYVDYEPGVGSAEASNLVAGLVAFGKTVKTFTDVSAAGLQEALRGISHLIIPEIESYEGNGADVFDEAASQVIKDFVYAGNKFLVFYSGNSDEIDMVNSIFDWSISEGSEGSGTYNRTAEAAEYGYGSGPASILVSNATSGVDEASLPTGGVAIYKEDSNSCAVALVPYGNGQVILFGWDWYNAQPVGDQDYGWLSVLDIATE